MTHYEYKETQHGLHLILSILFFPWAAIWLWRTLKNSQHNTLTFYKEVRENKSWWDS